MEAERPEACVRPARAAPHSLVWLCGTVWRGGRSRCEEGQASLPATLSTAYPASWGEPGQGAGACIHRKSHGQQPREGRLGKKGAKFTHMTQGQGVEGCPGKPVLVGSAFQNPWSYSVTLATTCKSPFLPGPPTGRLVPFHSPSILGSSAHPLPQLWPWFPACLCRPGLHRILLPHSSALSVNANVAPLGILSRTGNSSGHMINGMPPSSHTPNAEEL